MSESRNIALNTINVIKQSLQNKLNSLSLYQSD